MFKNLVFVFSLVVLFSACELTESIDNGVITVADGSATDGGCSAFDSAAVTGINDLLNRLAGDYQQGDILWRGLTSVASDEVMIPTQGSDWFNDGKFVAYHTHGFVPSDRDMTNSWQNFASNIFFAERNARIFAARGQDALAAQANFMAAWGKWLMLDNWGVIQVQNLDPCDLNEEPEFFRGEDAVNSILSNLPNETIADLPTVAHGEPTRAAAYAFLARLHLNRFIYEGREEASDADMNAVIANCDLVDGEGFALDQAANGQEWFVDNFGMNNNMAPEHIWAFANVSNLAVGGNGSGGLVRPQMAWNQGGWNGYAVVSDFYDTFDPNDPRIGAPGTAAMNLEGGPALDFGFLTGQQFAVDGTPLTDRAGNPLNFTQEVPNLQNAAEFNGFRLIKYEPSGNDVSFAPENDVPLLRYADVHLMRAEAEWRLGNGGTAVNLINQLRAARSYNTQVTSISSDGRTILDERGFELYNELIRRTDQVRFGTFQDEWALKPEESSDHTNLFPVPSEFVGLFVGLDQNPGY